MKKRMISYLKRETVLCIAVLLALLSMLWVHPSRDYIDYIDFRTLALLFCLMAVVAGMSRIGVFDWLAGKLLAKAKREWQIIMLLVLLCFFFGMVITNDVALVTFVPLAIIVLRRSGGIRLLIPVVAMQTIAANLGSMLTPVGNPQNLYLYGRAGISVGAFLRLTLPYGGAALVLILIWCGMIARRSRGKEESKQEKNTAMPEVSRIEKPGKLALYMILFVLCLLVVARLLPCAAVFIAVLVVFLIVDRGALAQVDYALLGTFVGFFVFIGNLGQLEAFRSFLSRVMDGHEVLTAIVSSQVMSNVPAALLLSGFTENYEKLIIGVNLGGLGTLIASMASLISFKYLAKEEGVKRGKYIGYFTASSLIFLVLELALCACFGIL
ncbi:MAG: anion permease [Agathobacter sp.]|nr:anion permease [Agathobacter sp.]